MNRGEIYWANLGPPKGRRPVCVLTRDTAIAVRTSVTCAPITRTIRGIRSEVRLGREEGLRGESVVSCDNVFTVPKSVLDRSPTGRLTGAKRIELDRALRHALDIRY